MARTIQTGRKRTGGRPGCLNRPVTSIEELEARLEESTE